MKPEQLKEAIQSRLAERLSGKTKEELNEESVDPGLQLIGLANMLGGRGPVYEYGVLAVDFESRDALDRFCNELDNLDYVENYEIRVSGEDDMETVPYDNIPEEIRSVVIVYVSEDYIDYGYYENDEEFDDDDSDGIPDDLTEVTRKIKVNARGVKRIKMKCLRGYKWDSTQKACVKITGAALAKQRKSLRRAVLTKKSMGGAFKARVLRKTRKAMRYRKALGLNKG